MNLRKLSRGRLTLNKTSWYLNKATGTNGITTLQEQIYKVQSIVAGSTTIGNCTIASTWLRYGSSPNANDTTIYYTETGQSNGVSKGQNWCPHRIPSLNFGNAQVSSDRNLVTKYGSTQLIKYSDVHPINCVAGLKLAIPAGNITTPGGSIITLPTTSMAVVFRLSCNNGILNGNPELTYTVNTTCDGDFHTINTEIVSYMPFDVTQIIGTGTQSYPYRFQFYLDSLGGRTAKDIFGNGNTLGGIFGYRALDCYRNHYFRSSKNAGNLQNNLESNANGYADIYSDSVQIVYPYNMKQTYFLNFVYFNTTCLNIFKSQFVDPNTY